MLGRFQYSAGPEYLLFARPESELAHSGVIHPPAPGGSGLGREAFHLMWAGPERLLDLPGAVAGP